MQPSFPFPGARQWLETCQQPPCVVEQWTADNEMVGVIMWNAHGGQWVEPDADRPLLRKWNRLNGALAVCIGDPLSSQPAGDQTAVRTLWSRPLPKADPKGRWRITFSGANQCALEGTLELSTTTDRVWANDLHCDGVPWHDGGPTRARELLGFTVPPTE